MVKGATFLFLALLTVQSVVFADSARGKMVNTNNSVKSYSFRDSSGQTWFYRSDLNGGYNVYDSKHRKAAIVSATFLRETP